MADEKSLPSGAKGRVSVLNFDAGVEISENESCVLNVELHYPRSDNHINVVELDQCSVRASDSIRITYDYDRDGWAILQAQHFSWDEDAGEKSGDYGWKEVAFVESWGSARECAFCKTTHVLHPSGDCYECGHKNGPA